MPNPQPGVGRHLRERVALPPSEERTDRELLRDFSARRDESAFAAIVRRHGPLVLDVCRHVLRHAQDAEDAFQATFLVLARKAGSVRKGEALASWLYGVAYHMSTRAKRDAARRRAREAQAQAVPPSNPAWTAAWREVQALVDEEVQRLAEKYRAPFVLCLLEGQTRAEAARQLGLKEGTVWSRLAEARRQLQERLARRGVSLSAVLALTGIFWTPTKAPAALLDATARVAADSADLRAGVLALAEGAMRTMTFARAKVGAALLLACGILAAGAGLAAHQLGADRSSSARAGPPRTPVGSQQAPRHDPYGDPLPRGARLRLGTARLRHDGRNGGLVTFSAAGKALVSAHGDGGVHVWESATGKELRALKTLPCFAEGPAALSSGGTLVGLPVGNSLCIWDLTAGKELHRDVGHGTDRAPCLAFSADGRLMATGSTDGARLWEVRRGKELRRFEGHRAAVSFLAFSPDGKVLAAKGRDGKVFLWSTATGKEVWQVQGNPDTPADLAWSPDGKTLALGKGKVIVLLDATARQLRRLEGPRFPVHSLVFAPDSRTVAATAYGGIHFLESATGKTLRTIELGDAGAGSLAFSPDGKILAATGTGSVVRLWQVATGRELFDRPGHRGAVRSVTFSPNGRLLATAAEDATVRLWDSKTGRPVKVCRGQRVHFHSALFSPDGRSLFASAPNGPVREWDVTTGKQRRLLEVQSDQPGRRTQVHGIALSADGTTLSALSRSFSRRDERTVLATWDLRTGKRKVVPLGRVEGPSWPPQLAPDGTLFARLEGPLVHVCATATGKELLTLRAPGGAVVNVAFAGDNRTLAAVCERRQANVGKDEAAPVRTLVVWELATARELHRVELGKPGPTYGSPLAFSPDGRFVAGGGEDNTPIHLWDLATGKELLRLGGQKGSVTCLAFSPDGTRLVSGLRTGVALVWDVPPAPHRRRVPPALSARRLEQLWTDLAEQSPARAHAALWELTASPAQTVTLLADRLRPVSVVAPRDLARLVADLDSDRFGVRQAASRDLEKLGPQAEAVLRQALSGRGSAELRRRARLLLAEPGLVRSVEVVRRLRAIQALEAIGSKEARRVLEGVAGGAPGAFETRTARASVERLATQSRRGR
jgi:RNA polymerase sigma factor (sigma-70 family)